MTVTENSLLPALDDIRLNHMFDFADSTHNTIRDLINIIQSLSQHPTTVQRMQKAEEALSSIAKLQTAIETSSHTIKQVATRVKHDEAKYERFLLLDLDLMLKSRTLIHLTTLAKKHKLDCLFTLQHADITKIDWSVDVDDKRGPLIAYTLIMESQQLHYTVYVSDVRMVSTDKVTGVLHTDYDLHVLPKTAIMGINIAFEEHLHLDQ